MELTMVIIEHERERFYHSVDGLWRSYDYSHATYTTGTREHWIARE